MCGRHWVRVELGSVLGRDLARVEAELVWRPEDTAQGLKGREEVLDGQGMLFDMRERRVHVFTMEGVLVPLDMIFIDRDRAGYFVAGVLFNVTPGHLRCSVGVPSRFVLEVPAGWAALQGVREYVRVNLPPDVARE